MNFPPKKNSLQGSQPLYTHQIFTLLPSLKNAPEGLTWHSADVEHVADDVLSVLVGLLPGHPHRGGRQGFGLDVGGLARQAVGPEHGEASAGLRGAGAVLRDALVDGLVVLADAVYGERAAGRPGGERRKRKRKRKKEKEVKYFKC